ncbi:hypothetical protein BZA77DRAFT_292847 [Pyronema omphalodes]|nr:hypothetical protein BZA77DRAFT_292847 [Pyronema omphalodes]
MRFLILLPVFTAIVAGTAIPEQPSVSEVLGQVTEPVQLQTLGYTVYQFKHFIGQVPELGARWDGFISAIVARNSLEGWQFSGRNGIRQPLPHRKWPEFANS